MKKNQISGFSLVEMLVVLGIIIILVTLSVPFLSGVNKASNLTYTADEFISAVQSARQRSSSSGKNVAIRIYKTKGAVNPSEKYRMFQLWEQKDPSQDPSVSGTAWVPLGKKTNFNSGIIAIESAIQSSLLGVSTGTENISGITTTYSSIVFTPAGRVDLPVGQNFITLVEENSPINGPVSGLPSNFSTISIETFNARPFLFKP